MKIRFMLAALATGATLALGTAACTAEGPAPAAAPTVATTPPPALTVESARQMSDREWGQAICATTEPNDPAARNTLLEGRMDNEVAPAIQMIQAFKDYCRPQYDRIQQAQASRNSDAASENNVEPGQTTSGDEQHEWGCKQGYITEGC